VARRSISFLQPLIVQGFALALTHYAAHTGATPAGRRRVSSYFYATLGLVLLIHAAVFAVAALFPTSLAELFFGDGEYRGLVGPAAILLFGVANCGRGSPAAWKR
jgi:hypothetical protein